MTSPLPSRAQALKQGMVRNAPNILFTTLILFTLAGTIAGEIFGAYRALWWWDDLLHGLAGSLLCIVGFLAVYFLNGRYNMAISPLLVAFFAFSFAISLGVLWEIFEFGVDYVFHTAMQQWDLPRHSILMGHAYQGTGLRDTMSDLILTWTGATIAAVPAYIFYKHRRTTALTVMRASFPWYKPQKTKPTRTKKAN